MDRQFEKKHYFFSNDIIIIVQCTGCPKVECLFWKCYCSKTDQHIDSNWCFLNSQHYIFWYSNLTFAKKKREIRKILIWKQWKIYIINFFFWNFLKKILKKNFDQKKIRIFFQIEIFFISLLFFAKVRFEYQNI